MHTGATAVASRLLEAAVCGDSLDASAAAHFGAQSQNAAHRRSRRAKADQLVFYDRWRHSIWHLL